MREYLKRLTPKKVFWVVFGVFLISFSISFMRLSNCGTDPFTCMNLGVSGFFGFPFGTYQLCINIILLIPMLIFYRRGLGLGTIVNMAGVGYICDFCMLVWKKLGFTPESFVGNWPIRIVLILIGLVLLCIGVAFYMECDLGISPYDAAAPMIEMGIKGKLKFSVLRVITDIICVIIGFVTGSVVGISTVITAFGTGPFVTFFREHLAKKVING